MTMGWGWCNWKVVEGVGGGDVGKWSRGLFGDLGEYRVGARLACRR
jgi:hypothetical protein